MPQLYIAATVTSLIALGLFGALIGQLSSSEYRWKLLCLGCMGLPLSPLAYFLVRLPLINILEPALLGVTQENPNGAVSRAVRDGVRLLYAPLTEEPSKLLPWLVLLLIGVLHKPTREQVVPVALTIGAAFAVGEFWLVAYLIAAKPDPALTQLPWYAFGGYMSERLMTCFSHTLFVLPTIWLYRRSRSLAAFGLAIGMILHYLGNAPIVLIHHQAFGLSTAVWSVIVQVWFLIIVAISLVTLVGVHFGNDVLVPQLTIDTPPAEFLSWTAGSLPIFRARCEAVELVEL